jgi:hypothetical protein
MILLPNSLPFPPEVDRGRHLEGLSLGHVITEMWVVAQFKTRDLLKTADNKISTYRGKR